MLSNTVWARAALLIVVLTFDVVSAHAATNCPSSVPISRFFQVKNTLINVVLTFEARVGVDSTLKQLANRVARSSIDGFESAGFQCSALSFVDPGVNPVTAPFTCCCTSRGQSFSGIMGFGRQTLDGQKVCPTGYAHNRRINICELQDPNLQACPDEQANTASEKELGCKNPAGNPCNVATGNKYHEESEFQTSAEALMFKRSYNSLLNQDVGLGFGWISNMHVGLERSVLDTNRISLNIRHADGRGEIFTCNLSLCSGDVDSNLSVNRLTGGFRVTHQNTGKSERYNSSGRLESSADLAGNVTSYVYDGSGRLAAATGPFGHTLSFTYNVSGHVATITDPVGQTVNFAYDANSNPVRVTYSDNTAKIYHYENVAFPHHLTGISYDNGLGVITRFSTFSYDSRGKAIATQHAQTDNAGPQEKISLNYDSFSQTTVTDSVGLSEVHIFATNLGVKNLLSKVNQSDGKSLTQTFDDTNNLTCKKDEEGRVTTFTYNSTNRRISMTEGLTGDCTAPVATSATRTTNFQYLSPTLSLPTVVSTPSVAAGRTKTTTLVYADAAHPKLPTQITQGGFTPAGVAVSRTVALTYNAIGQVASIDGPRTDVSDVTTLVYNACTTGAGCGQLASVTNALGQTTTYNTYDANGRVTEITDPNGLKTSFSYDLRGRVLAVTVTPPVGAGSARLTQSTYDHIGQLTQVILPDGVTLTYTYDAAQDLRTVTDNLGNSVAYTYDLKGNRTAEKTFDPAGTLVRSIDQAYDIRNRLSQINAAGSLTQQLRDAVGNLVQETDPNQSASATPLATTHGYDALNRLLQTVDNLSGQTVYAYDANDRLQQVTAPNSATTQFVYDDLGNLLSETSPDRGTLSYTYDAAGNVKTITDARAITATYTYDALNRVISITYPDPSENVTLVYDSGVNCPFGIRQLCQVTDESGATQFAYDAFGNIIEQRKTELGIPYLTRYSYDAGNRITSMTYLDGRLVSYTRDALGRIIGVTTTDALGTTGVASNIAYRADGLMTAMTFGNGLSETRTYDLQGRLTQQSLGSLDVRTYSYDANGNRRTLSTPLGLAQAIDYDALDRLTQETQPAGAYALTYDANGNRTTLALGPISASLSYAPNTNRLVSLSGIDPRTGVPVSASLTYDAAGNPISLDGQVSLAYNGAGRLHELARAPLLLARYTYNSDGQRTRKTTPLGTLVYHYDLSGNLLLETTDTGIPLKAYVWAEDQPLAQIAASGSAVYLHTDHLNTPRLATGAAPLPVWRWDSDAFGALAPNEDPDGDGIKTTVNLRFPGQYFDEETGLFYNWNRYYDPRIGRYITSDPIGLNGGLNTYLYVGANPLRFVDSTGEAIQLPAALLAFCARFPQMCAAIAGGVGKIAKACRDLLKRGKGKIPNKPDGIPDDWIVKPTKKGGGTKYVNPKNPHESVRGMPGNPKSPNPAQRKPYVKHMKDGKALDKNGKPVDPNSPEAHIPKDQYRYPYGGGA